MNEGRTGQFGEDARAPVGRVGSPADDGENEIGAHPRGTLLIVGVYGLLFALGWLILYFFVFLPRGVLTE